MRIYDINPEIYEQLIQDSSMYDDEYEDEFNSAFDKRIKSKASGEIVDIEIFAKSEEHLKKYSELYEIHKKKGEK